MIESKTRFNVLYDEFVPYSPEHCLLLAVLERAVLDANGVNLKGIADANTVKLKARFWLSYRSTVPHEPFSFEWICEMLDLNAKKLRQKLLKVPKGTVKCRLPWEAFKYFVS